MDPLNDHLPLTFMLNEAHSIDLGWVREHVMVTGNPELPYDIAKEQNKLEQGIKLIFKDGKEKTYFNAEIAQRLHRALVGLAQMRAEQLYERGWRLPPDMYAED